MKLHELFENYGAVDAKFNVEANFYAKEERERTKSLWAKAKGGVPLITHDQCHQPKYDNNPKKGETPSPGYRGEQRMLKRGKLLKTKPDPLKS